MARKINTMSEFAQVSGLSRPTVAKYFADPNSVRISTKRQIEEALKEFDYRPNFFAQNLKRTHSRNIGIIIPYQGDPFFAEIVRRIELGCLEHGYWAIVLSSHGDEALEAQALDTMLSLNLAGAIIAPLGFNTNLDLISNLNQQINLVTFDSRLNLEAPFVGTNNDQSISLIVDYLSQSDEAPCYVDMPDVSTNATERREAYLRAMARLGAEPHIIPVEKDNWNFEEVGMKASELQLDRGGFPSRSVLCANDRIAFGVLASACRRGLKVGSNADADIRIAGHDDHPLSTYSCPSLTTVAQDFSAIAEACLSLLLPEQFAAKNNERLGALELGQSVLFPSSLKLRSSA